MTEVMTTNVQKRFEISTEIAAVLKTAFEAIWTAPGRLLASILDQNGVDFGPPGAGKQDPANQKQRARFSGFGGSQKSSKMLPPNDIARQPGSKSVLEGAQARFWLDVDLILASIFDPKSS